MNVPTRFVASLLAMVALVAGACGRGDDRTPRQIVIAAATATADASSARVALDVEVPQAPGSITGEGAFDFDSQTGRITMTTPLGEGGAPVEVELRLFGTTMYQSFPPHLASFLGGKPWLKIDLAHMGALSGVDLGALSAAQSNDPSQALSQLRGVSDDVEEVGREELRGDDVTHYRFTIDLEKTIDQAPEEQREALRTALANAGAADIPAEAWIDDDDRLRKLVQKSEMKGVGTVTTTMELFDFGVDVSVEEPPADQVTDIATLLPEQRQN